MNFNSNERIVKKNCIIRRVRTPDSLEITGCCCLFDVVSASEVVCGLCGPHGLGVSHGLFLLLVLFPLCWDVACFIFCVCFSVFLFLIFINHLVRIIPLCLCPPRLLKSINVNKNEIPLTER